MSPTKWDNGFLDNLFKYEWELTSSPAGAQAMDAKSRGAGHRARRSRSVQAARPDDADDGPRVEARSALRSDLEALPRAPRSARRGFRKAWYKLLHRDMGPVTRYLGPWVPEPQLWQDPSPRSITS